MEIYEIRKIKKRRQSDFSAEYVLKLSVEEIIWLRTLMLNPINENESSEDKKMRDSFWNILLDLHESKHLPDRCDPDSISYCVRNCEPEERCIT